MWDLVSLKCTNWRVKCTLCALGIGLLADAFDSELAALGAAQIVQATAEDYDKRIILPEVGSSRMTMGRSVARAAAMTRRCFCPPDRLRGWRSAR